MSEDILHQIQKLQFGDKPAAERLLQTFIENTFSLDVAAVELRPLAVSLNSFNGFLTLRDGQQLFFKTHTEPDNVIGEYYNASRLAKAGYPVIQPIFSSTEAGKQFLIYEVITAPSVFDVAWSIENGEVDNSAALTGAQHQADDDLLKFYEQTLTFQAAEQNVKAPIHQLFHHRLIGGRLTRFYGSLPGQNTGGESSIELPTGIYDMRHVRQARWIINGQVYRQRLDDLIVSAIRLLSPSQDSYSIIGHGDAHNGNVFLQLDKSPPLLLYFDPAFAGRHDPLLDLTKPLFHNVFAMWMYFPQVKTQQTEITLQSSSDGNWNVEYDYTLHAIRFMFLRSKIERVLIPILRILKQLGQLRADWQTYLKAALFCCPFLTMNLTDKDKFTPEMSLLGLAMSIEMGAQSEGKRSLIDRILDDVAAAIA